LPVHERVRFERYGIAMRGLWRDGRYAAWMLVKSPAFTIFAVVSLTLGIGSNASIFMLLNTALLRPLPVERPRDLLFIVSNGSFSHPNHRIFATTAAT